MRARWPFGWPRLREIKDLDTGDVYLRRWYLLRLGSWALMLHHIRRPDQARCPHDHPWVFWTLVIRGGYEEAIPTPAGYELLHRCRPGRAYYRPAEFRHRIARLLDPRSGAWTLVLHGPRIRDWGFWVEPKTWVEWWLYVAWPRATRVLWCKEE